MGACASTPIGEDGVAPRPVPKEEEEVLEVKPEIEENKQSLGFLLSESDKTEGKAVQIEEKTLSELIGLQSTTEKENAEEENSTETVETEVAVDTKVVAQLKKDE